MLLSRTNRPSQAGHPIPRHRRRRGAVTTLLPIALILAATGAWGQSSYETPKPLTGSFHQPVPPYPVLMGFRYHHASTAFEGAFNGLANFVQSYNNYLLSRSQAAILMQQARSMDIANDWERLQSWYAYWDQKEQRIKARKEANRVKNLETFKKRYAPLALTPDQFDPSTGEIVWPKVLLGRQFDEHRSRLEQLLRRHFVYSEANSGVALQIEREARRMIRTLKRERDNVPRDVYRAAFRFLVGIKLAPKLLAA